MVFRDLCSKPGSTEEFLRNAKCLFLMKKKNTTDNSIKELLA